MFIFTKVFNFLNLFFSNFVINLHLLIFYFIIFQITYYIILYCISQYFIYLLNYIYQSDLIKLRFSGKTA